MKRRNLPTGQTQAGEAGRSRAYLAVFIDWYQAFDGHVPDVASSEEDFACRE